MRIPYWQISNIQTIIDRYINSVKSGVEFYSNPFQDELIRWLKKEYDLKIEIINENIIDVDGILIEILPMENLVYLSKDVMNSKKQKPHHNIF